MKCERCGGEEEVLDGFCRRCVNTWECLLGARIPRALESFREKLEKRQDLIGLYMMGQVLHAHAGKTLVAHDLDLPRTCRSCDGKIEPGVVSDACQTCNRNSPDGPSLQLGADGHPLREVSR